MSDNFRNLYVAEPTTLREVMQLIDRGSLGIAIEVDAQERFLRTITDGDLRRAILEGHNLNATLSELPQRKKPSVTAPSGTPRSEQLTIMLRETIRHLPLLNNDGTLADLALAEELVPAPMPLQAVIMAGGFGTRLRPLTDNTPKPMLQIGGRPLMERTIENFQRAGIHRINVTTHYLPEKITQHFGNGERFGVELNYVAEDEPLGTAGALRLISDVDAPLLVINGDILTDVDFRALAKFHQENNAAMTVAVRQYDVEVPYGVIEADGGIVRGLREKPSFNFLVNAGIYLLEPSVRRHIPDGTRYDMTDLIDALLQNNETVVGFPITEYWLDIGKHDDFQQAQKDINRYRRAA